MLDVHAPHQTIHSWKEFLVHIAAISIGLLIAVGLEQTVELFHHRHQVAEIRRSLADERRINEVTFTGACNEFRRYAPILLGSLQTLTYPPYSPWRFTQPVARPIQLLHAQYSLPRLSVEDRPAKRCTRVHAAR
jgi:hypothetical protein